MLYHFVSPILFFHLLFFLQKKKNLTNKKKKLYFIYNNNLKKKISLVNKEMFYNDNELQFPEEDMNSCDNFDMLDFMELGIDDSDSSAPNTPINIVGSPTPMELQTSPMKKSLMYPLPNMNQRSTNPHQQSYAPIYYQQNNNTVKNTTKNNVEFVPTNLPFWTAAPLPFTPQKFPPMEIIPDNEHLTEKDEKRLHRQEAIKKWMSKRTRRNYNRKVAPQKSQAACSRQRVGGKFISTDEETRQMEIEIERLRKQVEEEEYIANSLECKLKETQIELSLLRSHGLVNGMLKSQAYLPTLEPQRQIQNPSLDPRQSTIDFSQVRTKLKTTGLLQN